MIIKMTRLLCLLVAVVVLLPTASQGLECYECSYTNDGSHIAGSTGSRDCMRPDDPELQVHTQICTQADATCKSTIQMRYQYLRVIRECISASRCAEAALVDAEWTNITECCSDYGQCNDRSVDWADVDQHPNSHVATQACSGQPVELTNSGVFSSPVQDSTDSSRSPLPTTRRPSWLSTTTSGWLPADDEALMYNPEVMYPNGVDCAWKLSVPDGEKIVLNFEYLMLESGTTCPYDAVRIYDGENVHAPVLHEFCGSLHIPRNTVISSANHMYVTFTTDGSVRFPGFEASFHGVHGNIAPLTRTQHACLDTNNPAVFTEPHGYFHSPILSEALVRESSSTTAPPTPTSGGYRYCFINLCMNGGTCTMSDAPFAIYCACAIGFTGEYCDTGMFTDSCDPSPCQNGATCQDTDGYVTCVCPLGYRGHYCESTDSGICSLPLNRGVPCPYEYDYSWFNEDNRYYYDPAVGECIEFTYRGCGGNSNRFYSLNSCMEECMNTNMDHCASNPCLYGATCSSGANNYTCSCITGYHGERCELLEHYSDCDTAPCQNGATCVVVSGFPVCQCSAAYSGYYCEEHVGDGCASDPCVNGGTCSSYDGHFVCTCPQGYRGAHCQYSDAGEGCDSLTCLNGGTCFISADWHGSPYCQCTRDYGGVFCQHAVVRTTESSSSYYDDDDWYYYDDDYYYDYYHYDGYDYDDSHLDPDRITYPHGSGCLWKFEGPQDMYVTIEFRSLDLEQSNGCRYDKVEVLDSNMQVIAGPYCGTHTNLLVDTFVSTAYVSFTTDGSISDRGFRARYRFINATDVTTPPPTQPPYSRNPACGSTQPEVRTADHGIIQSPTDSNGDDYPNHASCSWIINVPDNMRIELNFHWFVLETGSTCQFDYVLIRDGSSAFGSRLGDERYCGRSVPPTIISITNQVYIEFRSDYSLRYRGFYLQYNTLHTSTLPTTPRTTPVHITTCYSCTANMLYENVYGDTACIAPRDTSDVDVILCQGVCREQHSVGVHGLRAITRDCVRSCPLTNYTVHDADTTTTHTTRCCTDRQCNSLPLIYPPPPTPPTSTPPSPPAPEQSSISAAPGNHTNPPSSLCYACTYVKSGKVELGLPCLQPKENSVSDVEECAGKCYVKRRVHTDGSFLSVSRGCESLGMPCEDTSWGRTDALYEEVCCTGHLCNYEEAPSYDTTTANSTTPHNEQQTSEAPALHVGALGVVMGLLGVMWVVCVMG